MKLLLVLAALVVAASAGRKSGYIIGGDDAQPGEFPWQASIQQVGGSHICGASLISTDYLVSTASCVGAGASALQIVLGMHDRGRRQGEAVEYWINYITIHPGWVNDGSQGYPNDIAVIELWGSATLNDFTRPIQMPFDGQDFVDSECIISGWGRTAANGPLPNILQKTVIDVLSQDDCKYYYGNIIQAHHTCVIDYWGEEKGPCNGDTGGPLSCRVDGAWTLAGAYSFGQVNCPTDSPSVYANVPHFRGWIRSISGV